MDLTTEIISVQQETKQLRVHYPIYNNYYIKLRRSICRIVKKLQVSAPCNDQHTPLMLFMISHDLCVINITVHLISSQFRTQ